MSVRLLVGVLVVGVGVVSACGGAADSGLFGGSGGGADSGSGGNDASTSHDGGTTHDGAVQPDGDTPLPDASTTPDAAQQPDSAPPGAVVKCEGTNGCAVGTDACCRQGAVGAFSYSCVPLGGCTAGLEIPCDNQKDCNILGNPGDVCCVTAGQTGATEVVCRPATECTSQQGRTALCDPNAPSQCAGSLRCLVSTQTIPGYYICR